MKRAWLLGLSGFGLLGAAHFLSLYRLDGIAILLAYLAGIFCYRADEHIKAARAAKTVRSAS